VKTRGHSRLHIWLLHSFLLHSLLLHTSRCAAGYTAGFQPRQPASRSTQTKKIAERKSHQVKKNRIRKIAAKKSHLVKSQRETQGIYKRRIQSLGSTMWSR
jgi:hypothetical protein